MNSINTQSYEIDSFIIRLQAEKVVNISEILNSNVVVEVVNKDTGNVIDTEEKLLKVWNNENTEIATKYEIKSYYNRAKNINELFYTIKITSKHLKSRYFEGITKENINEVYKSIMEQKIIFVEYSDFLSSYCTDIDFCINFHLNNYPALYKRIYSQTKADKHSGIGIISRNKNDNRGFQFGTRQTATLSKPFFKVYDKHRQINSIQKGGMKEFYSQYLQNLEFNTANLFRAEFTMKNKEMILKYGLCATNKLSDLLNIPKEIKIGVAKDILSNHTEPIVRQRNVNTGKLKSNEKLLLIIKDFGIKLGLSESQIVNSLKDMNFRYDVEKKYLSIIKNISFDDELEQMKEQLQQNEYLEKICSKIGFF